MPLSSRGGIEGDRHVHEAETDRAFPDGVGHGGTPDLEMSILPRRCDAFNAKAAARLVSEHLQAGRRGWRAGRAGMPAPSRRGPRGVQVAGFSADIETFRRRRRRRPFPTVRRRGSPCSAACPSSPPPWPFAAFCGSAAAASVGVFVADPAGKPLPDAVVMLEPVAGRLPVTPMAGVRIAQVKRQFTPQVSVVTVGTPVSFPNDDTVRHHVYSFSPVKTFELKLYSGDTERAGGVRQARHRRPRLQHPRPDDRLGGGRRHAAARPQRRRRARAGSRACRRAAIACASGIPAPARRRAADARCALVVDSGDLEQRVSAQRRRDGADDRSEPLVAALDRRGGSSCCSSACCWSVQVASFMALRPASPSMRTGSCRAAPGRRAAAAEPARAQRPDPDPRRPAARRRLRLSRGGRLERLPRPSSPCSPTTARRIGATEVALLGTDFSAARDTTRDTPAPVPLAERLADAGGGVGPGQRRRAARRPAVPGGAGAGAGAAGGRLGADGLSSSTRSWSPTCSQLAALDLTLLCASRRPSRWAVTPDQPRRRAGRRPGRGAGSATPARRRWPASRSAARSSGCAPGLGSRETGAGAGRARPASSLSVDEAVRLPRDLQLALLAITLLGIALFAFGSVFTARRVTTPLRGLADAAERAGPRRLPHADARTAARRRDRRAGAAFDQMRDRASPRTQAQILQLAYWDSLTGLPNRALLPRRGERGDRRGRAAAAPLAVLMLDLDRFKDVNDALGHRSATCCCRQVAERLQRQLVRDGDLVARLGGDEFARAAARRRRRDWRIAVARRIERVRSTRRWCSRSRRSTSAPASASRWPAARATTPTRCCSRADVAMYAAKRARQRRRCSTTRRIDSASAQTLSLMSELRQAVEHDELRAVLAAQGRPRQRPASSAPRRWCAGSTRSAAWCRRPSSSRSPSRPASSAAHAWVLEEAARQWRRCSDAGHRRCACR